eukprot:m.196952 g.196952  ORF g.196952 m.196952 type:complete len:868 (+) comp15705_c1_seq6:2067-4670(+)
MRQSSIAAALVLLALLTCEASKGPKVKVVDVERKGKNGKQGAIYYYEDESKTDVGDKNRVDLDGEILQNVGKAGKSDKNPSKKDKTASESNKKEGTQANEKHKDNNKNSNDKKKDKALKFGENELIEESENEGTSGSKQGETKEKTQDSSNGDATESDNNEEQVDEKEDINTKDKQSDPQEAEMEGEEVEEVEQKDNTDKGKDVDEEKEEEEKQEEEEEEEELEEEEDARARIEEEIADKHESTSENAASVIELLTEEYKVAVREINVSGREEGVWRVFDTHLQDFIGDARQDLMEYCRSVSGKEARKMIQAGEALPSRFGLWCPVSLHSEPNIVPNMFGQYPVIRRNHVYFMQSFEKRKRFMKHPTQYLKQVVPPSMPIRLAIVGPPKSGKTTTAKRISEKFGCKRITVLESLRNESANNSALSKQINEILKAGKKVPYRLVADVLAKSIKDPVAQVHGYILDGHPQTRDQWDLLNAAGVEVCSVIELGAPQDICFERLKAANVEDKDSVLEGEDYDFIRMTESYRREMPGLKKAALEAGLVWDLLDSTPSVWSTGTQALSLLADTQNIRCNYWRNRLQELPTPIRRLSLPPRHVLQNVSSFGHFCPVSWVDHKKLIESSEEDMSRTVEYKGNFFKLSSDATMQKFIDLPDYYLESSLPDSLPVRKTAQQVKDMFPKQVEFHGMCPVTYDQGRRKYEALKPGSMDFAVEYKDCIYTLLDTQCCEEFMQQPHIYAAIPLPEKVPPPARAMDVRGLPMPGYLEQTVSLSITKALTAVGLAKPKYPFMNLSESALVYVALFLKANNPQATEHSRSVFRSKLKKFEGKCELVKYLGKTMDRQHTTQHPIEFESKLSSFISMLDDCRIEMN